MPNATAMTRVAVIWTATGWAEQEMTSRLAKWIASLDYADEMAEREWHKHNVTATDLGLASMGGFEGPRLDFGLLLGESATWDGPGHTTHETPAGVTRCRGCGHLAEMPPYAYCLYCDRCGQEARIPRPSAPPPAPHRDGRLKGGR